MSDSSQEQSWTRRCVRTLEAARLELVGVFPALRDVKAEVALRDFTARSNGKRINACGPEVVAIEVLPEDESGLLLSVQVEPATGLISGRAFPDPATEWVEVSTVWPETAEPGQLYLFKRSADRQALIITANAGAENAAKFGETMRRAINACL